MTWVRWEITHISGSGFRYSLFFVFSSQLTATCRSAIAKDQRKAMTGQILYPLHTIHSSLFQHMQWRLDPAPSAGMTFCMPADAAYVYVRLLCAVVLSDIGYVRKKCSCNKRGQPTHYSIIADHRIFNV